VPVAIFFPMEDCARDDLRWLKRAEEKYNFLHIVVSLLQTDWFISSNYSTSVTTISKCETSSPISPCFSQAARPPPHSLCFLVYLCFVIQMFIFLLKGQRWRQTVRSFLYLEHFTVVCSVTWPLNGSEAGGDLVLIKTSLLLLCESNYSYTN